MLKKTPLHETHKKLGAKLVPFAGWEMPIQYTSLVEEHKTVRKAAGVFDVSHMCAIDLEGEPVAAFLRYLLANDVAKLQTDGQALYSCLLNQKGMILDDLIVYRLKENLYRLVVNAATAKKDIDWIQTQGLAYNVKSTPREDFALLAVQGPKAVTLLAGVFDPTAYEQAKALKSFTCCAYRSGMIARTGYTGEDGFEILVPQEEAVALWERIIQAGVKPIGLGARDTLRLEAGLNLYGQDMDETVTPFESNLSWTVDLKDDQRDFIGKSALLEQKSQGIPQKLVGVVLSLKGVLRPHMKVYSISDQSKPIGQLTSGSFSPTLGQGIGFAHLSEFESAHCWIDIRGKKCLAQVIKPPFVKKGKPNFESIAYP